MACFNGTLRVMIAIGGVFNVKSWKAYTQLQIKQFSTVSAIFRTLLVYEGNLAVCFCLHGVTRIV